MTVKHKTIVNNISYFAKLPNYIFYASGHQLGVQGREIDMMEYFQSEGKVVLVLEYLYTNTNRQGVSLFTLEHMIESCGYTPQTGVGRTNEAFKKILDELTHIEIITADIDMLTIKPKEYAQCIVNMFEKGDEGQDVKFFTVYKKHRDLIMNYKETSVKNSELYVYYCFLMCGMHTRNKEDGTLQEIGGKPEVTYPSYLTTKQKLGYGDDTISKYNQALVSLGIIRIANPGLRVHIDDTMQRKIESPNIYTLFEKSEKYTQYKLKEGVKYFQLSMEKRGRWRFLNTREYVVGDKSRDGYISQMDHISKSRDLTKEEAKKLQKYKDERNTSIEYVEKQSLMRSNPKKLLSEIYNSMRIERQHESENVRTVEERRDCFAKLDYTKSKMKEYKKLETNLHLVKNTNSHFNRYDDLIVDYETYYKAILEHKTSETNTISSLFYEGNPTITEIACVEQ